MALEKLEYLELSTYPYVVWDVTADGIAVDLTGATATVTVTDSSRATVATASGGAGTDPAQGAVAITDAAAGEVKFHPSTTITANEGSYALWLKIVTVGGDTLKFDPALLVIGWAP